MGHTGTEVYFEKRQVWYRIVGIFWYLSVLRLPASGKSWLLFGFDFLGEFWPRKHVWCIRKVQRKKVGRVTVGDAEYSNFFERRFHQQKKCVSKDYHSLSTLWRLGNILPSILPISENTQFYYICCGRLQYPNQSVARMSRYALNLTWGTPRL